MHRGLRILGVLCVLLLQVVAFAQPSKVQWSASLERADTRVGEWNRILVTAKTKSGWHIYGMAMPAKEGPTITTITGAGAGVEFGPVLEPKPARKFDRGFQMDVDTHEGEVVFALPFRVTGKADEIDVSVRSQACDSRSCDRPRSETLSVAVNSATGAARPEFAAASTEVPPQPNNLSMKAEAAPKAPAGAPVDAAQNNLNQARSKGLLAYLAFAFGAGLLALITPCVFPMIPITVSFFSKKTTEGSKVNYGGALAYSLGIIISFTVVGLAMTLLFGASGVQKLATNPWVNVFLAGLFVFLALSLFGLFELALPSAFVNKFQTGTRKGGWIGPALMGVTFSLTTFTCTVPFVGTVLLAATQGDLLYPAFGMFAFSSAFALPFFLLALFPQALAKLPKSGSWLATVKAFMGFLELAAALKFISNVDLVYGWGWLTRPVFLAIWSTLLVLAGLYLFGWILLGHDGEKPKVGLLRRGFALFSFVGAAWCLAGIQGKSLGTFGSFLPPEPYPVRGKQAVAVAGELSWSESFEGAVKAASANKKLVFVDFTGVTCTNCRWVEQNIFPDPAVHAELEQFERAKIYTDRAGDEANAELQVKLTKQTSLPVYAIVDPATGQAIAIQAGSDTTPSQFADFLKKARTSR